jgi:hypothetical protein
MTSIKPALRTLVERARRFWGPAAPADHPLSAEERSAHGVERLDEASRDWQGAFGDTLGKQ